MAGRQGATLSSGSPVGEGELGALIRGRDWAASPLGAIETWPQSLRTLTELILASSQPMFIAWGPARTLLYNDAYAEIACDKHPAALGGDFLTVWSEIADDLAPIVARAYAAEPVHMDDIRLVMERRGFPEETHFSFSYTPARDDHGQVAGFFGQCIETTERVLAARREAFAAALDARLREIAEPRAVMAAAAEMLGRRLGADRAGYAEIDADDGTFLIREDWAAADMPSLGRRGRLDDFGPAPIEQLRAGSIVAFDDADEGPLAAGAVAGQIPAGPNPGAGISVPLITNGRLTAFLFVHFRAAHRCTDEEKTIAADVAERTWTAMERARAETALRDSELRFRNMADNAPVMMWVTDPTGFCTYLNARWYEFTGQQPGQGEAYGWLEAVHPDDRPIAQAAFAAANAGRRNYRVDFRLRRADGVYRWVIDAAAARFSDSGDYLGYVGSVIDIEDRREIEDALRDSEERLRLATESAAIGTFDFDPVSGALRWDDRCKALFGLSPGAAVSYDTFLAALHPGDRAATDAAVQAALAPDGPPDFAVEYRSIGFEDGVERWIAARGRALFDGPDGAKRARRFVGTVIDISASKRAEELLEKRVAAALAEQRLFANIVEGTDAFVQVIDMDYRWLAVNKAAADEFEQIYGVRPAVGLSMVDILRDRPEHQDAVRTVWSRALAGEEFTEIAEFGDPSLARRHYEMKYNVLRGADGEQVGAYQFVYDVTDRIREQAKFAETEAERRQADALYRAYFENTAESLFVIGVLPDGGFTIEDLNPAHQASIGINLADVRGKRVDEVLPPGLADSVIAYYRQVIASGRLLQYRETFALNGMPTYWDTVLVPVRDEDGRVVRLIGASRDLTRQLAAEEQLRQAQKMEAMGQLTGGVAHDFNNLLTPIVGALDMLQRKGLGGEREQRLIGGAAQSAERAKTLVQRLLAFARRQPLQPVAVDLAKLVTGMADLVSSTTGPQIRVSVDVAPDLAPAKADPNQLEMAVLNLAVNARDAMPEGGTLRISVVAATVGRQHRTELPPGPYLQLSVADTGIGMDETTLARAVEPFFSTKGVGKGTGLGLSMVHGLATQLGGALTIRSTPGIGTNVELWLPQSEEAAKPSDADVEEQVPRAGRGTVLLVDDEDLVRLSTADMLLDLGYAVVETASAEAALKELDRGLDPDVVVTDHLPGMSGTELARRLLGERPGIKVLVVSGYAESEGIAPDLPRLTKPFRAAELAESLAVIA